MNEIYKKFGELLRSERERRNNTLNDLSEKLKISKDNLESVENGLPDELPSELYFKMFSKSYAEELGIDFERTIEAIKDDLGSLKKVEEKPKRTKPTKDEAVADESKESSFLDSNPFLKRLIYIFGAIILVFIIFIAINQIFFSSETTRSIPENNDNVPEEVSSSQVEQEELAAYDWDKIEFKKNDKIRLRLLPQEQSWATVIADGDTAIYRTLNAGRIYDVEADYRILLSVRIPSVVKVLLNGTEVNLVRPGSSRISRFEINQMNLADILKPPSEKTEPSGNNTGISDETANTEQSIITPPKEDLTN